LSPLRCLWVAAVVPSVSRLVVGPASTLRGSDGPLLSLDDSYLVDPASSHMLVSKTKPCMSKYKSILYLKLRIAH
jgi:hypothetical protein